MLDEFGSLKVVNNGVTITTIIKLPAAMEYASAALNREVAVCESLSVLFLLILFSFSGVIYMMGLLLLCERLQVRLNDSAGDGTAITSILIECQLCSCFA